jgi:hypothetical protein
MHIEIIGILGLKICRTLQHLTVWVGEAALKVKQLLRRVAKRQRAFPRSEGKLEFGRTKAQWPGAYHLLGDGQTQSTISVMPKIPPSGSSRSRRTPKRSCTSAVDILSASGRADQDWTSIARRPGAVLDVFGDVAR